MLTPYRRQRRNVSLNRIGGPASIGQGSHHKVGAVHVISACEHTGTAGSAGPVHFDERLTVRAESAGRLRYQGVSAIANGYGHRVSGDDELTALDRNGPAPARVRPGS